MSTGGITGSVAGSGSIGTITKAELLTRVKQITKRTNLTELGADNAYILAALVDLAKRTLSLKTSSSGALSSGDVSIAKPSDMVGTGIDGLVVSSMVLDPISFDQYLQGEMRGYCLHGDTLYLRPTASGGETYTLYYARQANSADVDSIPFGDEYRQAMEYYCASRVYDDYEIFDKAEYAMSKYYMEMAKHSPKVLAVVKPIINTGVRA